MEGLLESFRVLGFSEREAKVLSCLLKTEDASISEIEDASGIKRPHLYEILENLFHRGFVIKKYSRPARYGIIRDIDTFKKLAEERFDEISKALNRILFYLHSPRVLGGTIFVKNSAFLRKAFINELLGCTISAKIFTSDFKIVGYEVMEIIERMAQKVDIKVATSDLNFIRKFIVIPPYIRYVDVAFPLTIGIFDDSSLVVAFSLKNQIEYGVISNEEPILQEYQRIFKHIWTDDYLRTFYKLRVTTPKEY
ncbi:MAG: hypothetical protein DRJ36_01485 [Thermoprotei archaeon]|nr:MAG: hypothetical protein DRJ36_01485 [Thermoprotei archaeon]